MTGLGRTALLLASGIAIGCVLSFWRGASLGVNGGPGSSLATGAPSQEARILDELSALRRDNERLRADMDRMQGSRPTRTTTARAGISASMEARDATDEGSDADAELRSTDHIAAQIDAIQSGFQSQKRDTAWASAATQEITDAFKPDRSANAPANEVESMAASTIRESECRATLCRLVVAHADAQALASFTHTFPSRVPSDLSQVIFGPSEAVNGQVQTVIYLAKTGTDFPRADWDASP